MQLRGRREGGKEMRAEKGRERGYGVGGERMERREGEGKLVGSLARDGMESRMVTT